MIYTKSIALFKDGELDHYKEQDSTEYIYAFLYYWGQRNYVEDEKCFLTVIDNKEVNFKLL